MTGILPIHKPGGITSHTVTAAVKRLTHEKCGHGGTLDPMATGVLPVLVGKATRLADFLPGEKEYIAGILFGIRTDTGDITGTVLEKKDDFSLPERDFLVALESFNGEILQIPPMYSAIKKDGVKLYELARKGLTAEVEPRHVTIFETELLQCDLQKHQFTVRVRCSKGTYIRSLAEDIGAKLSLPSTLYSLTRSLSAGIKLENCVLLDTVREMSPEEIETKLISPETCFAHLPSLILNDNAVHYYKNGGIIAKTRCVFSEESDTYRAYTEQNEFLGLCQSMTSENADAVKALWLNG